jgi:Uma2 family endonuclease
MVQAAKRFYTAEEYLALEEAADYKSEYYQGEIFAMAGGTRNHSLITANTTTALNNALEAKPCEVHMSDLRLHVKRNGLYTYPDVMVICGRPEFVQGRNDTVTNPILIVEVLSPSTRDYDRVKKFALYKQLESLREYVLVDSEQVHVTLLRRIEGSDRWTIELYDDPETVLEFESVECQIPLRRMYYKVEFESET